MKQADILVVDDDENFLRVLTFQLQAFGFRVAGAGSAKRAYALLAETAFSLVITDLSMPGIDGIELLRQAKKLYPDLPVIVLTACDSADIMTEALESGAFDFLTKPFDKKTVHDAISKALEPVRA